MLIACIDFGKCHGPLGNGGLPVCIQCTTCICPAGSCTLEHHPLHQEVHADKVVCWNQLVEACATHFLSAVQIIDMGLADRAPFVLGAALHWQDGQDRLLVLEPDRLLVVNIMVA